MSSLVKPLEFRPGLWPELITDLRRRGGGHRESGAFLLGSVEGAGRIVQSWLPYDELDPGSLNYAYVRICTEAFSKLWSICSQRSLQVVADVHTHPLGPSQSPSDRNNPMIGIAGHIALIVPCFAVGNVTTSDLSVNVYLGGKRWQSHFGASAAALINLQ